MGLIKCPDCGKMVSDRAAACPSTSENFAGTPKVVNGEFDFPYVFATSNFHYHLDYMKFTVTKPDGRSFGRYFDLNNLPGEYGPRPQEGQCRSMSSCLSLSARLRM